MIRTWMAESMHLAIANTRHLRHSPANEPDEQEMKAPHQCRFLAGYYRELSQYFALRRHHEHTTVLRELLSAKR